MTPTERMLAALADRNCNPKCNGKGWTSQCPSHEDKRPSLSVSQGSDGRALVHCHTGCTVEAICAAVGLRVVDLMPTADALPRPTKPNGKPAGKLPTSAKHKPRIVATYDYRDEDSQLLFQVVRFEPKDFRQRRPEPGGGWQWSVKGVRVIPYHLPELLAEPTRPVFVVEGEKDCDNLASIGVLATCNAGGAGKWTADHAAFLQGRLVFVIPDNHDTGFDHARQVMRSLQDIAESARILELPGLPPKGDVSDWLDAHDAVEPKTLRERIEALADAAEPMTTAGEDSNTQWGPVLTCFSDIDPREVNWLWPGRIASGRINVMSGIPGVGKSFISCDMASRVSTGTPWPDGGDCAKGSVILISAEDDPHDTIRPRLDSHRADVGKIHLLSAVREIRTDDRTKEAKTVEMVFTLADVDALEAALQQISDCRLIVIDPIGSYLGGRTDAHRDNEVRGVLAPIAKIAERYGPAVLLIAHRRKMAGQVADDLVLGSRAFTGIARCVWHLTRDSDNTNRRLFLPGKNNLSAQQSGLGFSIAGDPAFVTWEPDPVDLTADDALVGERDKPGPEADALAGAKDWLRSALADGPRLVNDLQDEWRGSKRTLDRAKQSMKVIPFRQEIPGRWYWKLPPKVAKDAKGEQLGYLGNLGKTPRILPGFEPQDPKVAKLFELGNLGDDGGET